MAQWIKALPETMENLEWALTSSTLKATLVRSPSLMPGRAQAFLHSFFLLIASLLCAHSMSERVYITELAALSSFPRGAQ